jgi:hypothetical protein
MISYAMAVVKCVLVIRMFPEFMKPYSTSSPRGIDRFSFLMPFFWDLQRGKREAARKFTPIINERRRLEREMGSEYKKPVQSRFAQSS